MINVLTHMSDIMIPMVIFWIVGYGMVSGVKVYETFLKGAKEGLRIVVEILPTLVGLMMAVGILRTSGFFELLGKLIGPATQAVGLPTQLIPLLIVKMFSSSAATCHHCKAFFLLGSDRAGAGYFQDLRPGLLCRDADINPYELYRDDFLYHECVFSGGKGNENPLHAAGGTAGNVSGNSGKHFSCGENVMMPGASCN